MIGWLKLLFSPAARCAKWGHGLRDHEARHGYARPANPRVAVVDMVEQRRVICRRCRAPVGDWMDVSRDPIQSCSMSPADWRLLRKRGFVPF